MSDITVEILRREHIPSLLLIEQACFSLPWDKSAFEILLDGRGFGVVLLKDGQAVAYGGMLSVLDEGQVLNIATLPKYRRCGYGRAVLTELQKISAERGLVSLSLEVRVSNTPARELYRSLGWYEAGLRKGFYSHPSEDAVVMLKEL